MHNHYLKEFSVTNFMNKKKETLFSFSSLLSQKFMIQNLSQLHGLPSGLTFDFI